MTSPLQQAIVERDNLQDRIDDIIEERDRLRVALDLAKARAVDAMTRANNAETELAVALAAAANTELRQRDLDARVMVDAEVRKLRDQLNAMTDARDDALMRSQAMERNAVESRTKLATLSAMFRAAISALVRG